MDKSWEDLIALNTQADFEFSTVGAPAEQDRSKTFVDPATIGPPELIEACLARDTAELPTPKDREGYCGERHYEFWLLGLRDFVNLRSICEQYDVELRSFLDMGCASGRVLRHFAANAEGVTPMGCDINARHVSWCAKHLPAHTLVFQNSSIPTLPLPDGELDLVTAFSVFTHIEAFETTWLMELRRILRPGGLAYLTAHTEHTIKVMQPSWPIYQGLCKHPKFSEDLMGSDMKQDRLVFRWHADRSYTSNVFLHSDHIRSCWGRFFEVLEIRRQYPGYQDAVILRRR